MFFGDVSLKSKHEVFLELFFSLPRKPLHPFTYPLSFVSRILTIPRASSYLTFPSSRYYNVSLHSFFVFVLITLIIVYLLPPSPSLPRSNGRCFVLIQSSHIQIQFPDLNAFTTLVRTPPCEIVLLKEWTGG